MKMGLGILALALLSAFDVRLHWGHETRVTRVNSFEVYQSANGQNFEKVKEVNDPTELNVSTEIKNLMEGVVYGFYIKPTSKCQFFIDTFVVGLNLPNPSYEMQVSNNGKDWKVWDGENHFTARGKLNYNREKTPEFFRVVKKAVAQNGQPDNSLYRR